MGSDLRETRCPSIFARGTAKTTGLALVRREENRTHSEQVPVFAAPIERRRWGNKRSMLSRSAMREVTSATRGATQVPTA